MAAQYILACFICAIFIGNFKTIEAIVCLPNACDGVKCENKTSCPPGQALAPTFCDCCKDCVPIIRK